MDKQNKYIDEKEKKLIVGYDNIDLKKLKKPPKKEQNEFAKAAKNFIKKETKMNIRIDSYELEKIKERAQDEGLKYQTFVKSIIHKYISGQLVEKNKILIK